MTTYPEQAELRRWLREVVTGLPISQQETARMLGLNENTLRGMIARPGTKAPKRISATVETLARLLEAGHLDLVAEAAQHRQEKPWNPLRAPKSQPRATQQPGS